MGVGYLIVCALLMALFGDCSGVLLLLYGLMVVGIIVAVIAAPGVSFVIIIIALLFTCNVKKNS